MSLSSLSLGTSTVQASPVILGTWQAGKQMWANIEDAQSIQAFEAAYAAGIRTIDTAPVYGNGHSESLIGQTFESRRSEMVYLSKVYMDSLSHDAVLKSCEASLNRLRTDYIDLLQIHWPSDSFGGNKVSLKETLSAFQYLKDQGQIRSIGVSNFSLSQLQEACDLAQIDSLQPPYSLFWRHLEADGILEFCQQHQISVLAYSPLAQGILAGRFGKHPRFDKGDHRKRNKLLHPTIYPKVYKALQKLEILAQQKGVLLSQLALAWVLHHSNVFAIAGARSPEQVQQNAQAAHIKLTSNEFEEIDAIGWEVFEYVQEEDPVLWRF